MILIIASDIDEDMSIDLYNYLKGKTKVAFMGQNTIPYDNTLSLYPEEGILKGHLKLNNLVKIDIRDIKAIYTRLGTANFEAASYSDEEKRYLEYQRHVSIELLLENIDAMVINKSKSQFFNSSKLFQSWIIQKYGFNIPDSIITTDRKKVEEFIDKHKKNGVIYKSCSSERSIVKKFEDKDYENLDLIKACPHLFQECVEGTDIRVHTLVTGETYACKIQTKTSDYRYDKEREIIPIEMPKEIAEQCVRMTADMGLYLSGVDLRVTEDGRYYCFEVNPSPAFSWYEYQTGLPITKAVGDMMLKADKYKNMAQRRF